MKRHKRLTSTTPLRAKRPGKPRRRVGACRPYLDWLPTQACRVTGKHSGDWYWSVRNGRAEIALLTVDPAHVRTRRNNGDLWQAISLARHLHEEQHRIGIKSFAAKYNVDLTELARQQTEEFLTLFPEYREDAA